MVTPRKTLRKINPLGKKITRGKDFVKSAYRNLGTDKFKVTPARLRQRIKTAYQKGDIPKGKFKKAMKGAGVHSFPGHVKKSKSGYSDGTTGLFTQSIKGMKGINFIEKAMDQTIIDMGQE